MPVPDFTGLQYNPTSAVPASDALSSVDGGNKQLNTFYWLKKAIIQSRKDQYFLPLASTIGMPKHFGKEIKVFEYVPLLDDRNINDQGIDAAGVLISSADYFITLDSDVYVTADATAAAALAAKINAMEANVASVTDTKNVTVTKTALAKATKAQKNALLASLPNIKIVQGSGNLYGSSKDIGTITGKLPLLSEGGGRVNRVGFTRIQRSGTLQKFGFFYEFDKESLDFDSDPELQDHLATELMNGAVQLTEAVLQKDLLAAAGTVLYAGAAVDDATLSGEGVEAAVGKVAYEDFVRLDQILNENRTPKQTKVITGSRLVDTRTISAGRVMFVGSEIVPELKKMEDSFDDKAFIPVHMYADAGNVLNGEIGSIDTFRIVQVPEMLSWAGAGADVGTNPGYRSTGDKYDVFPMLVIGDDSFTTIGFQTDGKSAKFSVITKMPGTETADRTDPYGETGFSSIKWYYGTLIKRPERIAMIKTIAPI